MNISQLLEELKDPSSVLSTGEKLLGGISVALLSMGVVFIILVIIALIITILQKDRSSKTKVDIVKNEDDENKLNGDDFKELVAVITASIAASTGNSTNNIIVRKIQRSNNNKSSWERMSQNTIK
ncbi:OadG family protein [Paraclostridium sordellii]|uniref:Na-transporting methylmalonyl-CoA/oxaloacetate decarboxylase n=1 Tax=Paraclostridium sordellii TaxID=1505 RepID=A0A0C7G414_PARSO|nr:OadG family protein [Paeniclostridium sordellii]QYE99221.1 OadG family protein [Paeniclostridium sordellii]CEN78018.1 Na-transporting methylmalonyl-CoA/oxaloacetate decarboxylase [[Clostridium] sordellii] [Paeniclostridium sordellii]CEP80155.1 Na-transporting methylmalonyl-CoA/oxaloacetate decarboxylase [[Clostridium] sordellii] [Paeniclostridium sordellii]CEQ03105.1 Na-transporting methylmalonyl-CoA/oxaloacetate decarboxylase [[Clostridium] sordellii] [Paeniclostridium sordellii]